MTELDGEPVFQFTRTIACKPGLLWRAWTEPELFAKWFNAAEGKDATIDEWTLEVGGTLAFTMHGAEGETYPNKGTIVRLREHQLLITEEEVDGVPMQLEVQFHRVDDETDLTIIQHGLSEEYFDGAHEGWWLMLEKLEDLIEDLQV